MLDITVIGLGLIGTSLALAVRREGGLSNGANGVVPVRITGYDTQRANSKIARERGAIDTVARDLAAAVAGAQLVVLAVPVLVLRNLLPTLAPLLPAGCVVTDVSSTKADVMAWAAAALPDTVSFVGGHPMAGSEQSGPDAAHADLFVGAVYCLAPDPRCSDTALRLVEVLATTVGARPYFIDAQEHDAYVAGVSHMPFVLATVLAAVTTRSMGWYDMGALAATGYRDMTRLASGDPRMHRDICATNITALTYWLNTAQAELAQVQEWLHIGDEHALLAWFEQAYQARQAWLEAGTQTPGAPPPSPLTRRSLWQQPPE